ncbi:MAG: FtsX-like permease family protein, partial [Bacilli bacterium]|nr:FtsX-like permease family protein [Bacilli bacterium]
MESVTVEEINTYGDSEYVKNFYYIYSTNMDGKDLEEAADSLVKETTETKTETETFGSPSGQGGPGGHGGFYGGNKKTTTTTTIEEIRNERAANGAFTVQGYSSYESMSDFINGNYTITEGEVSSDFSSNNCVISEELAILNELSIGDTITLVNPQNSKLTYELIISGIYKENTDSSNDMTSMFTNSVNTIITNSKIVESFIEDDETLRTTITPTFILTSKDVVEDFKNEVTEKGLSESYTITDNTDTVTSATKSIINVKTFATTFLIITLIIGGVVLLVINMINIRERKYEIGVLRTIGMKKSLVMTEFLIELLIVAVAGLLLGAGVGGLSSVKVANNLLATEIESSTKDFEEINNNFGGNMDIKEMQNNRNNPNGMEKLNGTISIEQVDSINAIVDFKVLMQLLGISLLLTIISGISACVAINRFQPLTILKERS